jgi:tetratricopeptide (TPR) repeat protein
VKNRVRRYRWLQRLCRAFKISRVKADLIAEWQLTGLLLAAVCTAHVCTGAGLHEYTAAEAPKHIGRNATVVGKVECIGAGRTYHYLQLDACSPNSPFQIIVNDNASGPELNIHDLKGVTIAVTGKIESQDGYPWIVVKSTTQIQPRSALHIDHISHADQKEAEGDLAGAIEEFNHALELNPTDEFILTHRGDLKVKSGDADGAIADYNRTLELFPNSISAYLGRGDAKAKKGDSVGAVADYDHAIAISPTPGALFRRAHYKLAIGDFDGVIADCDREIQKSPKNAQSYGIRGEARDAKGDFGGAVADFRMASTLLPDAPFYKSKLKQAQAEAAGQKSSAKSSATHNATSLPASAEVVDIPADQAQFGIKAGNIKVTFDDGHTETITKKGNCMEPHVSAKGDVGWIQCTGFDRKGYALNEKLIIRPAKGDQKEFKPDPNAPFIGAWTFVNDDSAVVIQSRSFHGPASFIRYDLATGKVTNKKDGRDDSEPPPTWAQPLST